MNTPEIRQILHCDLFSKLDMHFAKLMVRLAGKDLPELFLAAALVGKATREGHICLDLSSLETRSLAPEVSTGEAPVYPDLYEWIKKLRSVNVVGRPGDFRPLILDDRSRLYLYRRSEERR